MKALGKLLYFFCFAAFAVVAAVGSARIGRPYLVSQLIWAAVVATAAGAPGLIHRRAWPAALVLLPIGAYLVLRTQVPVPAHVHGLVKTCGFYLGQLGSAGHAYVIYTFPFDLRDATDLRLLLLLAVYATTGVASLLALSFRKALPAVAIFLVLLGFSLTVDGAARVVLLPVGFLVLAGCLLTLSRSLERRRWASAGVAAGAATAVIGSLLALLLLAAIPIAAGKPWQNWSSWDSRAGSSPHLAFNWMMNFPSLLNPKTNAQVMRVESPVASYWRANALDHFNGAAWLGSGLSGSRLAAEETAGSRTYRVPVGDVAPSGRTVTEIFDIRALYTDYLFAGGTPRTLVFGQHVPVFTNGSLSLGLRKPLGPQFTYGLTAVISELKPSDLVARGRDYPPDILPDTTLPFPTAAAMTGSAPQDQWRATMNDTPADREWRGLYQLNEQIVRGATDPYQITLRIEQYLRFKYAYSLTPPHTRYRSPYAAFLFDTRAGYCQHFAGAMAALERFNGIPARVTVGFTTGALSGRGTYVVHRTDAHSWVEVYFPHVGWVPFDPTPGRTIPGAGPSSTTAGFVDPFPHDRIPISPSAATTAAPKPRNLQGLERARKMGGASGASAPSSGGPDWLPWVLGVAAALVVWPLGRAAARRRGLGRGSPDGRLRAGLALVYAVLRDYGVSVPRSQTLEETSAFLREYLGLDMTALTGRVEAVVFGGRAVDERDLADLTRLRREMRRRLRARSGWPRAVLASYGLRLAPR